MTPALHLHGTTQPAPGTVDFVCARYSEHLAQRVAVGDHKPRSLKRTVAYLASFCRFVHQSEVQGKMPVRLGSLRLEEAEQLHFVGWLIAHFDRWKKGSTRADACGSVLGCFTWAEEEAKLIKSNPFHRPRKMKFPRTHHRAMRKQHYRAIRAQARKAGDMSFRLILFFCWHTGVRLSEVRLLEWGEIDWQGVVRLDVEKNKTGYCTGKQRIFGIGPRLLAVLREMHRRCKPGAKLVFLTKSRMRPWSKDNLGRKYARYRRLACVPTAFKLCGSRHGYSVRLIEAGESSKAIADQLGHSSTRMVETIYGEETRYDAEHIRGLANRAERSRKQRTEPPRLPQPKKKNDGNRPLFDGLE